MNRNFECDFVFVDCVEVRSVQLETSASEQSIFEIVKLPLIGIGYFAVEKHAMGRKSEVGPCSRS